MWTREKGIINEFIFEGKFGTSDIYPQIVTCGKQIYLLSVMSNGIYKIDERDSKVKQIYIVNIAILLGMLTSKFLAKTITRKGHLKSFCIMATKNSVMGFSTINR